MRKLIGTIVIIIAVAAGVIWLINWRAQNRVDYDKLAEQVNGLVEMGRPVLDGVANQVGQPGVVDHLRGSAEAKVIIVEYANMQCSGCAILAPKLDQIALDYGSEIGMVFRHFPSSIYPNAHSASVAAEAAGKQGKFFEMITTLFANQATWSSLSADKRADEYQRLAEIAGVSDLAQWREDYRNSVAFDVKIKFDQALGKLQGVDETPTLFLNGERMSREVASDDAKLREVIDQKLAE